MLITGTPNFCQLLNDPRENQRKIKLYLKEIFTLCLFDYIQNRFNGVQVYVHHDFPGQYQFKIFYPFLALLIKPCKNKIASIFGV